MSGRSKSSDRWLREHFSDPFVQRAKSEGWRSRAVFKLEEIDKREKLLRPGNVGDVGSGAGLPGLVLAIARPDVHFTLIEPMERRVDWLLAESRELGLDNVTVVRARAEEAKLPTPLTQVTARAVTALTKLIPATAHLVGPGGEMLFYKGARVTEEVAAAAKQIRKARLSGVEVLELGAGIVPEVTRVFRATVD